MLRCYPLAEAQTRGHLEDVDADTVTLLLHMALQGKLRRWTLWLTKWTLFHLSLPRLRSFCSICSLTIEAGSYGLDRMAPVDPTIASLIVSPDEAVRPDARCPRPQCWLTDLLVRAYNIAARMGQIGKSFSHLILGLSQVLQESGVDYSAQTLSDASLQTFTFMSRELGRLMSTVSLACRQVWLAQSSLSEGCHRMLRSLPVVPGHMFGPAAQQALERSAQVDQARQWFAGSAQTPRQMGLLPPDPSRSYLMLAQVHS